MQSARQSVVSQSNLPWSTGRERWMEQVIRGNTVRRDQFAIDKVIGFSGAKPLPFDTLRVP